jgi:hypothetical protein
LRDTHLLIMELINSEVEYVRLTHVIGVPGIDITIIFIWYDSLRN